MASKARDQYSNWVVCACPAEDVMLDNLEKTSELIALLEAYLPIDARMVRS